MRIVVLLLIISIYVLANYYVGFRMSKMLPDSLIYKTVLGVVISVGVVSFFLYTLLHNYLPYSIAKLFHFMGTTWLTFFLYIFIAMLLIHIVSFVFRVVPSLSITVLNNYLKENYFMLSVIVLFIILMLIGGYFKYLWKKEVYVTIPIEKQLEYHGNHAGKLRVVGVSDLHLGYAINKEELTQWVDKINGYKPDMVIISGDIVDISIRPVREKSLQKILSQIDAPMGVFACLGNHEYLSGVDSAREFFKESGIHLLEDNYTLVDSVLYVVGRDDKTNLHRKPLSAVMSNIDTSKLILLLDHQPDMLQEAVSAGVDLQFSGHTHEGQVWPISLLTHRLYENAHGMLKKGKTHIYTSSGIGLWGGKFRIGTQSEIVIFDFIPQNTNYQEIKIKNND